LLDPSWEATDVPGLSLGWQFALRDAFWLHRVGSREALQRFVVAHGREPSPIPEDLEREIQAAVTRRRERLTEDEAGRFHRGLFDGRVRGSEERHPSLSEQFASAVRAMSEKNGGKPPSPHQISRRVTGSIEGARAQYPEIPPHARPRGYERPQIH
jgi:hypothetical protein